MRKIIFFLMAFVTPLIEASTQPELLPVKIEMNNKARLQRGARLFMNYCSGCHSLRYMRYNRMAKDLGLTTFDGNLDVDLLQNNLIFTSAKIQDPIQISLSSVDARQWFGRLPPDLSLSARERGPQWIYTYLKSFYIDKNRPFGSNNLLVPEVAMPNILAPLQGEVIAVKQHDNQSSHSASLVLIKQGEMSPQQFDSALQDLLTFLVYVGEPVKLIRYQLGLLVLIFLGIFLVIAYQLKKVYWRNIL